MINVSDQKTIDSISASAVESALQLSLQIKKFDDPKLRKQSLVILNRLNDTISKLEDSRAENVDQDALKYNTAQVQQSFDRSFFEEMASRWNNIGSDGKSSGEVAIESSGPINSLLKDIAKAGLNKFFKTTERDDPSLLDHRILPNPDEVTVNPPGDPSPKQNPPELIGPQVPIPLPPPPSLPIPVSEGESGGNKPKKNKPAIIDISRLVELGEDNLKVSTQIEKDLSEAKFEELQIVSNSILGVDNNILETLKELLELADKQHTAFLDSKDDEQSRRMAERAEARKNGSHQNTPPVLGEPQPPTPQPTEDGSGGLLGMVAGALFGGKGLFKKAGSLVAKFSVGLVKALDPRKLGPILSKGVGVVTSTATLIADKVGDVVDVVKKTHLKDLGKVAKLGKLAKGIPLVGQVIAAAFAVYDFFDGFMNAGDFLGKAEEATTLWDKISVGVGSLVGGLVGIVDSITGLFGFETDVGGYVKEKISFFLADIPKKVGKLFDTIMEPIQSFFDGLPDGLKKAIKQVARIALATIIPIESIRKSLFPDLYDDGDDKGKPTLANDEKGGSPVVGEQNPISVPAPKINPNPSILETVKEKALSLKDAIFNREVRDEKKAEAKQAAAFQNYTSNNQTVNNQNTNVYQSNPISTRPSDDSFRLGMNKG